MRDTCKINYKTSILWEKSSFCDHSSRIIDSCQLSLPYLRERLTKIILWASSLLRASVRFKERTPTAKNLQEDTRDWRFPYYVSLWLCMLRGDVKLNVWTNSDWLTTNTNFKCSSAVTLLDDHHNVKRSQTRAKHLGWRGKGEEYQRARGKRKPWYSVGSENWCTI